MNTGGDTIKGLAIAVLLIMSVVWVARYNADEKRGSRRALALETAAAAITMTREEACRAGVGEYYLDGKQLRQFRFKCTRAHKEESK